ncbi:kinase-like protein [Cadophora sp. DSE1049]|nr:kinase-like protein [Cadophora sp. DSE1049]
MQIQQDTTVIISEHAHKLFATLVFAGLGHRILELLGEGIDDTDLPFIWPKSARERRKYLLCSQKKQDKPIECTVTWDRRDIIDILKTQWCMLAPVIEFTDNVEHYEFEHNRVLPWMEDHEFSKPGRTEKAIVGAFSSVWKIKIHPAHQRLECSYPYTALKRLHRTDEQSFSSQVATLKKFRKYPHASLAKLLATFRWKDKYYLIFPFPESNLREFWRATPLLAYSYDNVFWVLKQCRAITSGLHVIHTHRRYKHAPAGDRNHDEQSRFGPHGDLKAENILWFPEQGMEYGNLVIADSGLTDFHQCATRSDVPAGHVIGSPSYEPPELMLHSIISRAWDIWTLGCLFLELVTWLVCGSDVLEGFPVARREEDPLEPNLTDDTFFTIIGEGSSGASTKHAILRSAVSTWIKDLHKMPRCSAFVHDFLDLIANEMLLVDPKARIKIGDLNQEFLTMIERAKDPSYLTKGVPKTPRDQHDPNPSSLAALRLSGHIFPGTSDGTPLPRKASSD